MPHTPPIRIRYGKNSTAYLSLSKPHTLVIFVHGFAGEAQGTWDDFPRLIRTQNDFDECDVVFYGYESLKGQANNNALRFYRDLTALLEKHPNRLGYARNDVEIDFEYENVLIIGHSLGAIIIRRALLCAKTDDKSWLDRCRMVLFAPAHRGARIQNLVMQCMPILGKVAVSLGLLTIPVLDDLKPDSVTITSLLADSNMYLASGTGDFTKAHNVLWAEREIVVHNQPFCQDENATLVERKGHTKVCKPSEDYLLPYQVVVNAL